MSKSSSERAARIFIGSFILVIIYLLFKHAAIILLPFAIAYFISLATVPLSVKISEKMHIPRKICAAVTVTLFLSITGVTLYFGTSKLIIEAMEFFGNNGDGAPLNEMLEEVKNVCESISNSKLIRSLNKINLFGKDFGELFSTLVQNAVSSLSTSIGKAISVILKRMPSILISVFITVISCYMLSMDKQGAKDFFFSLIPQKMHPYIKRGFSLSATALKRYARGYVILTLITFVEVFIGLAVLKIKYVFLIALAISAVDFLPILGAGCVLVPWAVIAFFRGNTSLGVGLIILYGIITIIRQLLEARVIGSSIGLHPFWALLSMYAGLHLFGIVGLFLAPAALFVTIELVRDKNQKIIDK